MNKTSPSRVGADDEEPPAPTDAFRVIAWYFRERCGDDGQAGPETLHTALSEVQTAVLDGGGVVCPPIVTEPALSMVVSRLAACQT